MKKLLLSITILSVYQFGAKAQPESDRFSWCPNGASWIYKSFSPTSNLYLQFNYVKDTLISNITVKKLDVEPIQMISTPNKTEFVRNSEKLGAEFLFNSNDSVYWFDKVSNNFKFIYSFNPKLNDKFVVGNSRAKCSSDLNFANIDTIQVNKLYKDTFENKVYEVFNTDENRKYKLGTIVKNIGSTNSMFPQINGRFCNASQAEYGVFYEGLICYSDSLRGTINFNKLNQSECHFARTMIITVAGNKKEYKFRVYPNPVQNFMNIENLDGEKYQSLQIYDCTGKMVMIQSDYKRNIDVSLLDNGVYFIKLQHLTGVIESIRFLKY